MMGEMLLDAMALLPEEMLAETDQIRQKKRWPWKGLAALAACLCLITGLFLLYPGSKSAENGFSSLMDYGADCIVEKSESAGTASHPDTIPITWHDFSGREYVDVTVIKVYDGMVDVLEGWRESYVIDGTGDLVSTAYLETPLTLSPGQHLRIYFGDILEAYMDPDLGDPVFIPERIELWQKPQ